MRPVSKPVTKQPACKVANKPVARPVCEVVPEDDIYNDVDRSPPVAKKEVFVSKYFGSGSAKGEVPVKKRIVQEIDDVTFSPEPKKLKLSADQHSTPKARFRFGHLLFEENFFGRGLQR